MKIDFHCHTIKTKSDEADTRNVSLDTFKEKILLSEVKIVSITNHNLFDKDQYLLFKEAVKENCQIWPGIELDVIGASGKKGHLILISDPNEVDIFSSVMDEVLNGYTPDNFEIGLTELHDKIKEVNLVYVVHCFKHKGLSLDDIEEFERIISNKKRLFKEPGSLTSVTVLQSNKHRVVIGTDVIDWSKYEEYDFGEFKFNLLDFSSFTKIIEKDLTFIKDIVNEELSENIKVYGKADTKEFDFEIPIYKDVNIVFGDKGSGKSEILESLNTYYTEIKNEEPVYYRGGEKEAWYKDLIKTKEEDYDIQNIPKIQNNENEIRDIVLFSDTNPVSLKKYFEYFKNESNNSNKKRMKCLSISKTHLYNDSLYKTKYEEHEKIAKFLKDFLNSYSNNILEQEEKQIFIDLLNKLYNKSFDVAEEEWLIQKSEYLLSDFVDNISTFVSESIGEPSPPTETGFAIYAKNRLKIRSNVNRILEDLNANVCDNKEFIGNLGTKGDVYLTKNYNFINHINKTSIDSKTLCHNKTDLQPFIINLEKISSDYTSNNLSSNVNFLKELYLNKNIKKMEDFMSIRKDFTIEGNPYKPSKGEMSILSLQHDLLSRKTENIFLIDEPDLSLGGTYINDVIVPLFKDLSRAKKILVVATHDANIAVRTRPLNSILKITSDNMYKTYVGNLFTDRLVNIDNSEDILSWKDQSVKYLEGGEEAFVERGDLYE